MKMENDVLDIIKQQNEGITLGLGALAEVLQKMDARLEKQALDEDVDEAAARERLEEEEEEKAYEAMVKSMREEITKGVLDSLKGILTKQDQPMAELHGDQGKKVSGTKWPMSSNKISAEQEETSGTLDNSGTETVQKPIEAMEKQLPPLVEEEEEGSEEFPEEEDEGQVEEEELNEMALMRKQLASLKKENDSIKKNMANEIQKAAEERMRKMGFREETGLVGPKLTKASLGKEDKKIIKSAQSREEVVEQLRNMSWSDLNELRFKIESGETDGLPRELVQ